MKMTAGIGLAAVMLAFAGPAAADDDCANPMAQQEMNRCAESAYEADDAQLNAIYRKVSASLDAAAKAKLIAAERAWIARRDRECKEESAENEGGSIYPLVYNGCLSRLTKARIGELRAQLH